jgi:hypothetical protein
LTARWGITIDDPRPLADCLPTPASLYWAMGSKSREVIWGGAIMGANMRAQEAREAAETALREANRAEAFAWSVRMGGYGGPAQPSPNYWAVH